MKIQTWRTYRDLTITAIEMICRELDSDLSCQSISDQLGVSPFYFHRIFKAVCGEGPSEMATRLRMERSAHQLRNSETSITEIAFDAGFESLEGFSRNFRQRFGDSPSSFRKAASLKRFSLETPNGVHWLYGGFNPTNLTIGANKLSTEAIDIQITEIQDISLAAMRHIGPYYEIGNTFAKLRPGHQPIRMFAIYYDDPNSTPPDQLRSDACYELQPGEEPCEGTVITKIEGGKYATYRHIGHYRFLGESWGKFMDALANSEEGARPGPAFEEYVDDCRTTPVETLRTDLYAPVN